MDFGDIAEVHLISKNLRRNCLSAMIHLKFSMSYDQKVNYDNAYNADNAKN